MGRQKPSLLGFAMHGMLTAARAKLLEFKPIRIIAAILFGGVISILAIAALKRNNRANVFLF